MSFTRGPWQISNDGGLPIIKDQRGRDLAYVRDGWKEGPGKIVYLPDPEIQANAVLMVAAPELLEALEAILYQVAVDEETELFSTDLERLHEKARALTARARGAAVPS